MRKQHFYRDFVVYTIIRVPPVFKFKYMNLMNHHCVIATIFTSQGLVFCLLFNFMNSKIVKDNFWFGVHLILWAKRRMLFEIISLPKKKVYEVGRRHYLPGRSWVGHTAAQKPIFLVCYIWCGHCVLSSIVGLMIVYSCIWYWDWPSQPST